MDNKRMAVWIVIFSSLVLLMACSNRNIVTEKPEGMDTSEQELGSTYGFTMFNMTADTTEMKSAVVAEYDEKKDKIEAVYENKIDDFYLHGNEAMEKLNSIFEELALDPEVDDEDMIKKTSEAFEVNDYRTLKLNVKFKGYDTKELMMTK